MSERDYVTESKQLNDRIARATTYGAWQASQAHAGHDLPYSQTWLVNKILALCGESPILYVASGIAADLSGTVIALTEQLLLRADAHANEGGGYPKSFDATVTAEPRNAISRVEIIDVDDQTDESDWPHRVEVKLTLPSGELTLPLSKQIQHPENLAEHLPSLLADLARS
jgi:hypothetical protein